MQFIASFNRLLDFFQKILRENLAFILDIFFFNFQPIAYSLFQANLYLGLIAGCALWLSISIIACGIINALPFKWLRSASRAFILGTSFLLWILEVFALFTYKAPIGAGIITAVLETNQQEAREFYHMYVGWPIILGLLGIFLALIVLNYILRHCKIFFPRLFAPLILLLGLFGAISIECFYHGYVLNHLFDPPFYHIYNSARTALSNMDSFNSLSKKLNTNAQITENKSSIPYIVLILGEAMSRHHMALYGYYLPDTPNLCRLKKEGKIAVFTDCISPHSTTVAVLRELFTFHDYESSKPWYEYPNLIDVMKKAGYKTYWLSNQESSGVWGNVALVFANRCDFRQFTRLRDSHEDFGTLDGALLPILEKELKKPAAKNFYVIHLMGGHSLYYERYPYSFAKFDAKDIKGSFTDSQKLVLAQYANAIYYNDYIVSSIIKKFAQKDALVIYLPDHGETIYDNGSNFAGHVEENPNRYMLEIPMIIYGSKSFRQKYPQKWQLICQAVHRPYMTDDMIDTILNLSDIKTPQYNAAKSIINSKFNAARPRLIHGISYDNVMRYL